SPECGWPDDADALTRTSAAITSDAVGISTDAYKRSGMSNPTTVRLDAPGTDKADAAVDAALSPEACILRHVSRASRAVVAAYDPALGPYGLTGHQFNLMMTLGNMGPMTVGALADVLGMDASGVPRAVRPLADQGLIVSQPGEDRRQRMLSLTAPGRAAL